MARRNHLLAVVCCQFLLLLITTTQIAMAAPDKEVTPEDKAAALEKDVTQGALRIVKDDATIVECPLKHTDVKADISGFIARVKVTQTFHNPTKEKIEAVYVFPLPHEAAVDDMTMVISERKIVGVIKRRAEARQIYEQALHAGQTAALLEQERPNIFTQSVGNIEPGQEVRIEISYSGL
jgi:Ca-activated chloride channel family protein